MKTRLELHEKLCALLGTYHTYFQPPESIKLSYPCLVYSRNADYANRANNRLYMYEHNYQLTYITDDAETDMPMRILSEFPKCRYERMFVLDNLYHHIFNLYY